jgi:erythromycin esterase
MEYVKIENIAIGGFDVQRTGGAFKDFLKVEVMKYEIDTSLAVTLEDRFLHAKNLLTNRKTKYDDIQKEINTLINDYKIVHKLLKQKSELDDALKITDQTILNRVLYLNYMLDFVEEKDWNKRWAARDMAMAKNVLWLIDNFYEEDKILIIGHNFHISKSNENEETMGEVLDKQYELDMFVIGVFAGEGSYSGNYGSPVTMLQADSARLDIKHIISQLKDQIYFIQIPKVKNSANKWMFEKIVVNDTFIDLSRTNEMNLSKHFDGLLLIDKVSPAVTK